MRWARSSESLSAGHPAFRDALADFAATLHGVPKDEIAGEDVRQHRKTVRLTRGAAVILLALTAAAIFFALFALQQRDSARQNARTERAGRLAALAVTRSASEPELALLTAIEAVRLDASTQVRSAFADVLGTREGRIAGFVASTPLGFSPDGRFFGVYLPSGEIQVRRTENATLVWRVRARSSLPPSYGAEPGAASVSSDGSMVALPFDDRVLVYGRGRTFDVSALAHKNFAADAEAVLASAFLGGNRRLVLVVERTTFDSETRTVDELRAETWDVQDDRRIRTVELAKPGWRDQWRLSTTLGVLPTSVSLSADGTRVAVLSSDGIARVNESQTGKAVGDFVLGPGIISLDGDGGRLAWRNNDDALDFIDVAARRQLTIKSLVKAGSGAVSIALSANGEHAVGWWVDDANRPTRTYLQNFDLDELAAGGRWSPQGFASLMVQPPRLDPAGTRLLAAPNDAFNGETVLYSPLPATVLAEGVGATRHRTGAERIVALGPQGSTAPLRPAGVRLIEDSVIDASAVAGIALTRRCPGHPVDRQ